MNIPVDVIARYVFALLLCTGLDATARDVYLRCRGSLTLHTAELPLVKENQEIAIHVQAKTMIYVSGSQFIVNASAPICPNRSPSPDELRFDSRSCTESAPGGGIYGSYNRILEKLDISDDRRYGDLWLTSGVFRCVPAKVID